MISIDLSGKTAVVTGATGDLGRVMVRTLAQAGSDVAIHYYRNQAMANALLKEIQGMGVHGMIVQADITSKPDVERMRDEIAATLGAPHIVVNNAVSQYKWTSILEQPAEDFVDQFETCVLHNLYMAKAFLPAMIQRKGGRFIGINTECSALCNPGSAAYASAKRGMDGLYRTLAKEVGPHGITVNQIAPGWMISDRDRASGNEHPPETEAKIWLRHRGTDQDIANAVVFLASELAAFITGVYLPVCGGNVMPGI